MVDRVYDPSRGVVSGTPQQNYVEWLLSQLGRRVGGINDVLGLGTGEVNARAHQAEAARAALAGLGGLGEPTLPPPWQTGGLAVPPDPITPTDVAAARRTQAPISAVGDPTLPPPWQTGGLAEPPSTVLPALDRDRALPPLTPGRGAAVPTPAAMLGGNNYAATGGGGSFTGGGGTVVNMDAARAASPPITSSANAIGGLTGGGLGGLNGPLPLNAEAALSLYEDETGMALRQGFQDAGINSFENPYAARVIKRYAPILGNLMDFFALAAGHDPEDQASMAVWVPQFIKQFMSGEINPQRLVQRALELAEGNPVLKEYLVNTIGPNRLLAIQGQTSGYGDRVEGARQRVLQERLTRQQMAQLQNPAAEETKRSAWLDIVRGGAR